MKYQKVKIYFNIKQLMIYIIIIVNNSQSQLF